MTDTIAHGERVLLGAILLDNSQLSRVNLGVKDFANAAHGQVFEVAARLIGSGTVTDALTVAEALERETGRKDWLSLTAGMTRDCLAPGNAPAYAEAVRRASIARHAARIGERLMQHAAADDAVSDAIRDLLELSAANRNHVVHILDAMQGALDELSNLSAGKLPGVRTGMRDLDDALGGLHAGDLVIVAARPAMGKTAFALNLAAAADCGVGVISGEQGRAQIGMRMMAIDGPASLHRMRTGALSDDEWARVTRVMHAAKERPIWIYDRPGPGISEVVSQARAWRFHQGIGVLLVDYLQKISGGAGKEMRLQVGDVAAQFKNLARELSIPVVVLAQVKREVESRPMGADGLGRMPYMSDIAESGIVEQEADQVMTLYRPEVYDETEQHKGVAIINICKNRHGPVGFKRLSWRGEYLKFGDLAHAEDRWGPR